MEEQAEADRGEPTPLVSEDDHNSLHAQYRLVKEQDQRTIQEEGGPESYVRKHLPLLRQIYPGPWTDEVLAAETNAGWWQAEERLRQCAKCPAQGGACEGATVTGPEGMRVELVIGRLPLSPATFVPCDKGDFFRFRSEALRSGIPQAMIGYSFDAGPTLTKLEESSGEPGGFAWQALHSWVRSATNKEKPPSFLITGGTAPKRTELAAAIARRLLSKTDTRLSGHYTFGPRLASEMRDFFDKPDADREGYGPLVRCEQAPFLVFDFCDPKPKTREPWAPWFVERVDMLLWKRLGDSLPTVLVSPKSVDELWSIFTCASAYEIRELDISSLGLG